MVVERYNFTHTFQSQTHPLPPLWPQSHIQINDKPNNLKGGGKSCQKELLGGWEFWKCLEDLGGVGQKLSEGVGGWLGFLTMCDRTEGGMARGCRKVINPPLDYYDA